MKYSRLCNINTFRNVGYYEFMSEVSGHDMYFNYWVKSATCTKPLPMLFQTSLPNLEKILVGTKFFSSCMMFSESQNIQKKSFRELELKIFLLCLKENNFGIVDNLFNLFPELKSGTQGNDAVSFFSNMSIETMTNHLFDLSIKSVKSIDFDKNVVIVSVGSNEFSGKTIDLAMTSESIPQSATDVIPILIPKTGIQVMVNEKTGEKKINTKYIYTTIGYKSKQPSIHIDFSGEEIDVLSIGLFGAIPGSGEHLNPDEKSEIVSRIKNKNEIVKLNKRQTTFALRAIAEEIGMEIRDTSVVFICGEHDKEGRDQRYHTYTDKNGFEFGYERYSKTYVTVVVNIVDELPDEHTKYSPEDTEEISSSRAISLYNMIINFKVGGLFEPAVPSHVEILNDIVVKKIVECVKETSLEIIGDTTLISSEILSETKWNNLGDEFVIC